MAETTLRAPFPWFGGKSRAAGLIWSRLGDVSNYVWMGQVQFRGWRPVRFVVLLVDHRCSRRASTRVLLEAL